MTEKRAQAGRECVIEPMVYAEAAWDEEAEQAVARLREVFPAMGESAPATGEGSRDRGREAGWEAGSTAAPRTSGASGPSQSPEARLPGGIPLSAEVLAEAEQRGWERGWNQGMQAGIDEGNRNGQEQARASYEQLSREDRERVQATVMELTEGFAVERERYFHAVEQESVRLALAIAARILRREAQMDPLLLSGAVRVALGQVSESTSVRLLVPEPDAELWRESLRLTPGLRARPEVVGVSAMKLGECRIETEFGNVDMGLLGQLQEVERGFFDRVASQPHSQSGFQSGSQPSSQPGPQPAPLDRTAPEEGSRGEWAQPSGFRGEAESEVGVPVGTAPMAVGEAAR